MRVFLSWSGSRSHQIALILNEWLPSVIQSLRPWVSSEDIYHGTRWSSVLAGELEHNSFGIICLTKENLSAAWLNFEAGALSKALGDSRVIPLLFHMQPSDVTGPLAQFQQSIYSSNSDNKKEIFNLLKSLNTASPSPLISDAQLESSFEMWWPKLEEKLSAIPQDAPASGQRQEEVTLASLQTAVEEILRLTRDQHRFTQSPTTEEILTDALLGTSRLRGSTQVLITREDVDHVLGVLPEGEGLVLTLLYGLDDGLKRPINEVAAMMGLSIGSVRRLEARALRNLRGVDIRSRLLSNVTELSDTENTEEE